MRSHALGYPHGLTIAVTCNRRRYLLERHHKQTSRCLATFGGHPQQFSGLSDYFQFYIADGEIFFQVRSSSFLCRFGNIFFGINCVIDLSFSFCPLSVFSLFRVEIHILYFVLYIDYIPLAAALHV